MKDRGNYTGSPGETREALLWLRKLAEQAARNRRESGLDATQQIEDVLAIDVGAAPEPPSAGRDFRDIDDATLPAFLISARSWFRWACVALIVSVVVVIAGGMVAGYSFFH